MNAVSFMLDKAASTTWALAPYVVVGVVLGELLRYTPITRVLERVCRQHPAIAILSASLFGIVSPLCTYGTVPVVLELLRAGVAVAPLATFLAASSLMNPQLFFITLGGLNPDLALGRVVSVLGFGLILGGVLHFVPRRWSVQPVLAEEPETPEQHKRVFSWRGFAANSWRTLEFVGFYVLLGIVLGTAVEVLVPGRWLLAVFGTRGWVQVLVAALLGLPMYACGGGTVPLVASLLSSGMARGAALSFLVAGPGTRIPPLLALATILRPRFIVAYVVALVLYSVAAGLLFELF